ncbi:MULTISPECIES: hypothetical protein [unclassified Anaeromyxobacter]|uniref:hypothetical protein n=1 Tax=unclassified Anaeromyxobacter TaxID=2620896 RepID=UPI001F573E73|nr:MULTISPECIES: hypothetical protein [unclassified Anaeromyxobacter]
MQIRKMALALPFAFGIACSTSHANRTARTEGTTPATASETTARSGTQSDTYGTSGSATAQSPDIKGHDSDKVLMGKVASVSSNSVSIQSDMGDSRTLQVVPETIVTVDGRTGQISDIQQGQDVRASFNEQDGKQVAVKIEAAPMAGGTSGHMGGDMGGHMGGDTSTPSSGTTSDTGAATPGTGSGTGTTGSDTSGSSSTPGTSTPSDTGTSSGSTGTGGGYDTSGTGTRR